MCSTSCFHEHVLQLGAFGFFSFFFFFPPSFFPLSRLVSDSQKRHTEHNIFLSFHEPAFKGIIMKKRRAEWA